MSGSAPMDPKYEAYYMSAFPNYTDYASTRNQAGEFNVGRTFDPMSYEAWKALQSSIGSGGNNGGGGGTTPPPTPPPELLGLIAQASDPWSTYGQMGVANPYLSAINTRFGYNPQGLAFGYDIPSTRTWYNPPYVYPETVLPKISGGSSKS